MTGNMLVTVVVWWTEYGFENLEIANLQDKHIQMKLMQKNFF